MKYVHYRPVPDSIYDLPVAKRLRSSSSRAFGSSYNSTSSSTQTQTGATRTTAVTGGGSGKVSGFVSTRLRARRVKKDKFNTLGTTLVSEIGGVVNGGVATSTSGNVVAIGHACCPSYTAATMVWRAIVKRLIMKLGVCDLSNFDLPVNLQNGDTISVQYQLSPDLSINNFVYTIAAGANTPNQIAAAIALQFRTNYDPNISFNLIWISQNDGRIPAMINLKTCKLVFSTKSTLKIQNNSVEATGGDEESVNNVPLHGKAYFGYGTGTEAISRDVLPLSTGTTFRADNQYGAIAKVPTERWYQEVVPPSHFTGVKQFGKVVLDPGHVKTSVLSFYGTMTLNSIYRKLFDNDAALLHTKTSIGSYRFMLLEKMIQATTPTAENAIKVSYEVNLRMGVYALISNSTATAQQNDLMNIASSA